MERQVLLAQQPPPASSTSSLFPVVAAQVLDLSQVTYPYPDIFVDTAGFLYGGTLTSLDRSLNTTASGGFEIVISPEAPASLGRPGVNWLKQDFPDAPIQFVFRIYWGDDSVRRDAYQLPPIRRVGASEQAVAEA